MIQQIGGIAYALGGIVMTKNNIDQRLLNQTYENNMRDAILNLAEQHASKPRDSQNEKGNQGKVGI